MSKINRENLLTRLNEFKAEKEVLENTEFTYRIKRHWPGIGEISEIDTAPELVNAYKCIHDGSNREKEALEALNMLDGTFDVFTNKDGKEKHYGYTLEEWDAEMMTKRNELATQAKIEKLTKAIAILEKNMSEDDKFAAEMSKVDELLG